MYEWKVNYELREERREEFLATLKMHGLFQLTDEGLEYFFRRKDDDV